MGSKKTTTSNQTQANTYGHIATPITSQMQDYRDQIDKTYNQTDPSIAFDANNQRKAVQDRFDNPYGANYSPEVSDAIKYNENQNINQQQGQNYRNANYANQQGKLNALGGYAGMTADKFVQTGGTSSGTTVERTPFNWGAVLGAGAQVGSAAIA